jgi:hypothetical protein
MRPFIALLSFCRFHSSFLEAVLSLAIGTYIELVPASAIMGLT